MIKLPFVSLVAVLCMAMSATTASATTCSVQPSKRDVANNLTVLNDPSCGFEGGRGCITTLCRYCRLTPSMAYAHLLLCSEVPTDMTFAPVELNDPAFSLECMSSVTTGDALVGINLVTDVSCVMGGVGCMSDLCRYCQTRSTPQSSHFMACSAVSTNNGDDIEFVPILPVVVPANATGIVVGSLTRPTLDQITIPTVGVATPTPTTPAPTTLRPVTPAPTTQVPTTPAPTTPAPITPAPITPTPTTPAPTTPQPTTPTPAQTTRTPVPTTPTPTTPAPTTPTPTTPTPTTSAPTTRPPTTPVPTTPAPTTPRPVTDACAAAVAPGDALVGISALTDSLCQSGGLGCFSATCRFCKLFDSIQSQHLMACKIPDTCPEGVSPGDALVGISAFRDPLCANGGLGCFSTTCRFCKKVETIQSAHLLACTT